MTRTPLRGRPSTPPPDGQLDAVPSPSTPFPINPTLSVSAPTRPTPPRRLSGRSAGSRRRSAGAELGGPERAAGRRRIGGRCPASRPFEGAAAGEAHCNGVAEQEALAPRFPGWDGPGAETGGFKATSRSAPADLRSGPDLKPGGGPQRRFGAGSAPGDHRRPLRRGSVATPQSCECRREHLVWARSKDTSEQRRRGLGRHRLSGESRMVGTRAPSSGPAPSPEGTIR